MGLSALFGASFGCSELVGPMGGRLRKDVRHLLMLPHPSTCWWRLEHYHGNAAQALAGQAQPARCPPARRGWWS